MLDPNSRVTTTPPETREEVPHDRSDHTTTTATRCTYALQLADKSQSCQPDFITNITATCKSRNLDIFGSLANVTVCIRSGLIIDVALDDKFKPRAPKKFNILTDRDLPHWRINRPPPATDGMRGRWQSKDRDSRAGLALSSRTFNRGQRSSEAATGRWCWPEGFFTHARQHKRQMNSVAYNVGNKIRLDRDDNVTAT